MVKSHSLITKVWQARELSVKWAGIGSAGGRKLWLSDRGENAAHALLVNTLCEKSLLEVNQAIISLVVLILDFRVDVDFVPVLFLDVFLLQSVCGRFMQIEKVIQIVKIINTRIVHLKDLVIFLEDDLYPSLKLFSPC